MIESAAESLSLMFAMIAVAMGLFATFIWFIFASKLTDLKVKIMAISCMAAILLITLSEIPYIIGSLESRPASPETADAQDTMEYLRYIFIAAGYFMLALAAKTELQIAREHTFIGSRFKKAERKGSNPGRKAQRKDKA